MLSEKSATTIRATLPAVGAAIGDITGLFYDRMFAAHPELFRDLFNRGNQANGTQRQALAGSIAAFASALLENPDVRPDAMLARIAHKHASLGVTRDQYAIVHKYLFEAIVEVLGEAVTPEVAEAWNEVYWLMANALIAIESRLYAEAGAADGDTWREYRIVGRYEETADVATFLVRPVDDGALPPALPGQYVSVQVELPDGAHQIRQYSLTGTAPDALRFAVKRIVGAPDGEVSNFLHDRVSEGAVLRVSAPFGDVSLDDADGPVVLASAGIGCTPIMSMLDHLSATNSPRQIVVAHGDYSPATHAFRSDLEQLVTKLDNAQAAVWYEVAEGEWPAERTGFVDLRGLSIPADATAYLCGPLPFLRAVRGQLLALGLAPEAIHYEVFGPDLWLAQQ